ncbi:peptidoglycan recognition protein family protein [Actinosynnema mirum]|uniref:N-acetylmuramoyl-L-alanine amidase n=1 Tax=Actinosynnema mirum (strain ATCC 29888 / DSM 43827 / JCM 3225 / NBRC 14064 / NCIMB 13271 / NRRL B-12336 / IMRU 3971 / 101) TaxID=446462 RepID=C6WL85_ACTMD|nr:peptidoglycan recognition family protein [Actinosynnema mirum]ACU36438.1 N-acetylmuramyl-L-alanine amidase, negative regulator of AmpC, AmpD [Actinosynnema mirum DSM 43827]
MRPATAALAATLLVTGLVTAPGNAFAASGNADYAEAAREFGVPEPVLLGVAYLGSRWDSHAGSPSRAGGYGPMHLTDAVPAEPGEHHDAEDPRGDPSRPLGVDGHADPAAGRPGTLARAAELTDQDPARLRTDRRENIRGGAALLASLRGDAGEDLGSWYAAVARYSGADDDATARRFADDVYEVVRDGATRVTDTGDTTTLAAHPDVRPDTAALDALGLPQPRAGAECPARLGCEWVPAPYENYDPTDPGAYGNHDQADRPNDLSIDYIVIHDTETSYEQTLELVQDPTYVSWHYTIRSRDGHVAQHVENSDVAWHAGNWFVNSHAIGIEHEGYAAQGSWYTEAMYRNSARLVRYLADRYDVPLDRAHILGHDNVPGTTPGTVAGMHWDPGPYWDWSHYFDLLGAPLPTWGAPHSGVVTPNPDFATNRPRFTGCESAGVDCPSRGSTSLLLHTEPAGDAPLVADVGLRPDGSPSTRAVSDIGARIDAGQRFAVAERRDGWTAIWYLGQKSWFRTPEPRHGRPSGPALVVTPKPGLAQVPVYGRAYPEQAAYAGTGAPPQSVLPLQYAMPAGQRYVVGDVDPPVDYYFAQTWDGPHVVVSGQDRYHQVFLGHRVAYVRAADVDLSLVW